LSDGSRQITGFDFSGDIFGIELGPDHRCCAEAIDDLTLTRHSRRRLETIDSGDPRAAKQIIDGIMRCLADAQEHMLLLGRKSALAKVAGFLLWLAERTPNQPALDLPMTRSDIGDFLALRIETVSRCLRQLERDGLVRITAVRRVEVRNLSALRRLTA
jgi:CRP/FNR family nitrogen fixation transcriptional regulator